MFWSWGIFSVVFAFAFNIWDLIRFVCWWEQESALILLNEPVKVFKATVKINGLNGEIKYGSENGEI